MLTNKKNQKENKNPKLQNSKKQKSKIKLKFDLKSIMLEIKKNPKKKNLPKNLKQILSTMESKKNSFYIDYSKIKKILKLYRSKIFPFFLTIKTANKLSVKTFTLIIYLFFYHFSKKEINEGKINELLCLAYASIACKFEEIQNIDIEENIIFFSKNGICESKILNLKKEVFFYESIILTEIDFFVRSPWVLDLAEIYCIVNSCDEKFFKLMEEVFICRFLKFPERIFFNKNGLFICAQRVFLQTLHLSLK